MLSNLPSDGSGTDRVTSTNVPLLISPSNMLSFLFIFFLFAATYSYFWYPALLATLPRRKYDKTTRPIAVHRIAIVVAARNEAGKIVEKIENTLALAAPGVHVEVIVASDASDDATDEIVRSYETRGVRLARSPVRKGKECAQELAIQSTDADIIVFTDAGTILPKDALEPLLTAFQDPTIGAVSSVDRFITEDGSLQGEGAYVRYEMWLRDLETRFHSLVGLSGSFFAARHRVCERWDNRVPSDFGTALACAELGLRAVSDRRVVGYYKNISDNRKEYQRKVRTVTRGMSALRIRASVLNPFRYGRFSFEVFSHKVMRWLTPWFLIGAICVSAILALSSVMFQAILAAQLALYLLPVASRIAPSLHKVGLLRIGAYFVEVNAAILHATLLTMVGRTILTWEPSKR